MNSAKSKRLEKGLCIRCGKQPHLPNRQNCSLCAEFDRKRNKKARDKCKKENLCVTCRKQPCHDPMARCYDCVFKMRATGGRLRNRTRWKEIQELWHKQNGICPYLGVKIPIEDAELDHIVAKAAGGDDSIGNLQWVHKHINRMKQEFSEQKFRFLVKRLYENLDLGNWTPD